MSHVIINNGYHLIITSNDNTKKLVIDRVTSLQGAVYDGDGKCLQHDFGFRGYEMYIYGIKKCHEYTVNNPKYTFPRYENRLCWVTKSGQKYNVKKFADKKKKDMIALLETFMCGQFTEAWHEITKK